MRLPPDYRSSKLTDNEGCGISVVVVPTYLNEIAPPDRKGSIGVLNQLGIVTGIFVGQTSSLALATSQTWSYVFLISAALAGVHVIAGSKANESPIWLAGASAGNTIGESKDMPNTRAQSLADHSVDQLHLFLTKKEAKQRAHSRVKPRPRRFLGSSGLP